MHWLGYNNVVSWLNVEKTRIFQPTANFENFKIHLYPVALGLHKFHMIKVMAADLRPKMIYPLRHENFFYPSFLFLVLFYSFSKV